jgi:hypothetical protein
LTKLREFHLITRSGTSEQVSRLNGAPAGAFVAADATRTVNHDRVTESD